ncbi:MAG: hypothetical protein JW982_05275 [Spirochaetes bacterium]|nr:hypothetical protein [Spirochaetota bacterium]
MTNSDYEQKRFFQKFKEYLSLFLYIIFILLFSIIIMDLVIFPATVFAVNNKVRFSEIFIIAAGIILVLYVILKLTFTLHRYIKDRLKFSEILTIFVKNRISAFFSFFIIMLLFIFVIGIAKWLLEQNYYLIYKTLK